MPELPEVQIVVNGINNDLAGRDIVSVRVFWDTYVVGVPTKQFDKTLSDQSLQRAERRGKYILIFLDRHALLLHLRMTGKLILLDRKEEPPKHTHVILEFADGGRVGFNDARKFGRLEVVPLSELDKRIEQLDLGLEPFSDEWTAEKLSAAVAGRSRCIKNILLDQKAVAGIGNIYACEILHAAKVHPLREGYSLAAAEVVEILSHTHKILRAAIERGGASVRDYIAVNGESGNMQNHFTVYNRAGQPCPHCDGTIEREVVAGRSTYWCSGCQK